MDKPFFIGQRSLQIVAQRQVKQKLIGFMLDAGFQGSPQECHLVIDRGELPVVLASLSAQLSDGILGIPPTRTGRKATASFAYRTVRLTATVSPLLRPRQHAPT